MDLVFVRRVLTLFLPAAAAVVLSIGAAYLFVQQDMRIGANDEPQQLAEDGVAALDGGIAPSEVTAGPTIDAATSLRPFVAVFDTGGALISTNGSIAGAVPAPPIGVLVEAQESGRDAVTWAPRDGVRIATVVLPWRGGTILAGRSLRLVEERIDAMTELAGLAVLGALVVVGVMSVVAAVVWPRRPGSTTRAT